MRAVTGMRGHTGMTVQDGTGMSARTTNVHVLNRRSPDAVSGSLRSLRSKVLRTSLRLVNLWFRTITRYETATVQSQGTDRNARGVPVPRRTDRKEMFICQPNTR